jgi:hypothetical protein
LEKENDQEVSSGSTEKVATDVAGDKEGGIGTPKKWARATELQKLQVGNYEPNIMWKMNRRRLARNGPPRKSPSKITKVRQ